jgi:DNA-binding transcriptional MerR regulator
MKVSAVRYYERVGLLKPTSRTRAGYRDYADDALQRIALIRRAQEVGFTLREIAVLVGSNGSATQPARLRELIDSKLTASRARRASLQTLERDLAALRARLGAPEHARAFAFELLSQIFTTTEVAPMVAQVPGWLLAGSRPEAYEIGLATETHEGRPVAYLRSAGDPGDGFGTLMQQIGPDEYVGGRLSFSAFVRSEGVDRAGLWLRIDGAAGQQLAFDNMQQTRPVTGTQAWTRYEIVLDVDPNARKIAFGVLLIGVGDVRIAQCALARVGPDVAVTAPRLPARARSLDFSERPNAK